MRTNENLHVCPWWLGWVLVNPLRKWLNDPERIVGPYIKPGMRVVDYGCAMGYFTLPMARMVGEEGRVYAVDIQQKMIDGLFRRALKAGLEETISPILVTPNTDYNDLTGKIDFVLLFAVAHEVPDRKELFRNISLMLKPGGNVLFAEPSGHVSAKDFDESIEMAVSAGLKVIRDLPMKRFLAIQLSK